MSPRRSWAALLLLVVAAALSTLVAGRAEAQEADPPPPDPVAQDSAARDGAAPDSVEKEEPSVRVGYGDKGFWVGTADGNYLLHAEIRLQFRYSYPFDVNPVTFQEFEGPDRSTFKVNRARIKIGGNGYRPWLKYYFEYELAAGVLLDLRFMVEKLPELSGLTARTFAQFADESPRDTTLSKLATNS